MGRDINLRQIKIRDPFWSNLQKKIIEVVIPFQERVLNDQEEGVEKSHALDNFRIAAGLKEGEFYGMVFQDSDVAKWLEGVAYSLAVKPDPALEQRADDIIAVIEKAQQPDGYLNTYFTIKEPEHRWQNLLECHELYCAGHMMEAAVAYYEVTGKDRLLKVMERMADHIAERFGPDREHGIPGHQEVEIGLMRMYRATGKEAYKCLARYFLEERGKNPAFFEEETKRRGWEHFHMDPKDTKYNQSHATVYEQDEAVGHSVRAVYMYTAMADLAAEEKDEKLFAACRRLFDNVTEKKMFVTGGIGSTVEGEAFSVEYELPNDTNYAETCASIGLVFFAHNMLKTEKNGRYADVMERALYNGIISGMQLDGKRFFYVNPLEVNPGVSGEVYGYRHVLPERPGWYACACCPPNLVRLVTSLAAYAWDEEEGAIYSHLFLGQEAALDKADIRVESTYPWEGSVSYYVTAKTKQTFALAIHIPAYIREYSVAVNGEKIAPAPLLRDGYLFIERVWGNDDTVRIEFEMPVRRIYANACVRADAGCVALMRGPVVYCFEGVDNGEDLQALAIPRDAGIAPFICREGVLKGLTLLTVEGIRSSTSGELYSEEPPREKAEPLRAVPYFAWGNRGITQMRVWMREK